MNNHLRQSICQKVLGNKLPDNGLGINLRMEDTVSMIYNLLIDDKFLIWLYNKGLVDNIKTLEEGMNNNGKSKKEN